MDNPSAFPQPYERAADGMTLRDWFAGQALAGICGNPDIQGMSNEQHAGVAYDLADRMLAARTNGGQSNG